MSAYQHGQALSPPARPARRTRCPNLSLTRPPSIEADAELWPAWCDIPVDLFFELDVTAFDENGFPLTKGGC